MSNTLQIINLDYYRRIFNAYLFNRNSGNTSFWHTELFPNRREVIGQLKNYYMDYTPKTAYQGPFDENGVPMLNYYGAIGIQYNPDAVAQYALGHFERYLAGNNNIHRDIFIKQADWFVSYIKERDRGIGVWEYDFDWEYYRKLKGPWYTSLGQGHGISVLTRAHSLTGNSLYLDTARKAFLAFKHKIDVDGGVMSVDENNCVWFEEAVITPCTHILNGFVWALWGIYDYWLATEEPEALDLFSEGVKTLEKNIHRYDNGFWTTYDLAKTLVPGIASPYYHNLHIVQMKALFFLTGRNIFLNFAEKWEGYKMKMFNRRLALVWKAVFKVFYY